MSEKQPFLAPDLIEIYVVTREVLCASQDLYFNSPNFEGEDEDFIF